MAQDLAENSSLVQDSVPPTVREVQVDGNTLSSDGKGSQFGLLQRLFFKHA